MNHPSQEILHLFVLGSQDVVDKREELSRHLDGCARCREIVGDLREFGGLSEIAQTGKNARALPASSLVVRAEVVESNEISEPVSNRSFPLRAWNLVRQRPLTSGISAIGVVGLIALSTVMFQSSDEPDYFMPNKQTGAVDVYGKQNKLLWSLPSSNAHDDPRVINSQIILARDPESKTVKLISCSPLGNVKYRADCLYAFGADGAFDRYIQLPTGISKYRGYTYSTDYVPTQLSVFRQGGNEPILIGGLYNTRSPMALIRFDNRMKAIGEYWHFGQLKAFKVRTTDRGVDQLAFTAINDRDDIHGNGFTTLGVLDPLKIVGKTESSATPGFGLPVSVAEEYYIRFPETDMAQAVGQTDIASAVESSNDSTISVQVTLPPGPPNGSLYYYFDNRTYQVVDVKYSQDAERVHAKLKSEGKITSIFDKGYLENLKKGVRYWDGRGWKTNPTQVVSEEE